MCFCGQQEIVIRQIGEVWNDTIGEKPSYGREWRAGDQCAAASMRVNIHFSDADSGTAGIADEMSVQKTGSPVKAAQQTQQNPQETQFPKED